MIFEFKKKFQMLGEQMFWNWPLHQNDTLARKHIVEIAYYIGCKYLFLENIPLY